jgi:hypothetical protein
VGGRELHDPEIVADGKVGVQPPAEVLVEALGASMSATFNVTTSRFRSAVAGAGISAEVLPLTSVLVMVASIDSLSAPASRLAARLAPVGSLVRTLGTDPARPGEPRC